MKNSLVRLEMNIICEFISGMDIKESKRLAVATILHRLSGALLGYSKFSLSFIPPKGANKA